ncbi:hypothetical protein EJ07DRAFT_150577 [Lizonia empirigonia]|nr:hypothetical protein EJ07DRAFT_150577 [Lizonia empirigonia]
MSSLRTFITIIPQHSGAWGIGGSAVPWEWRCRMMSNTAATIHENAPAPNRWRSVVETVVQTNKQVVEMAQCEEIKDAVQKYSHLQGRRTELNIWKAGSFDTATWLYHFVFGPSVQNPSPRATLSDMDPETHAGIITLRSASGTASQKPVSATTREMIVRNAQTEPGHVVDTLLFAWTTLTAEHISLSAGNVEDWSDRTLDMSMKPEADLENDSDSEISIHVDRANSEAGFREAWSERTTGAKRRLLHAITSGSYGTPVSRPQVRFMIHDTESNGIRTVLDDIHATPINTRLCSTLFDIARRDFPVHEAHKTADETVVETNNDE